MNPRRQTILFQGDSITDGNRDRNEDPNPILGHGFAFTIASSASNWPATGLILSTGASAATGLRFVRPLGR
ncbi:hypothetical protein [Paenibacillus sp. sptzw28]|uniref:hypothetical protein n=1 Tax=Paenibacillus sp. sptzw28 TaxID=715179 RepID=UPI0037CBE51E